MQVRTEHVYNLFCYYEWNIVMITIKLIIHVQKHRTLVARIHSFFYKHNIAYLGSDQGRTVRTMAKL